MHPRWLAILGFLGLCTSFACFPPLFVGGGTLNTGPVPPTPMPWPPTSPSPSAAAGPSGEEPQPSARAYLPVREGTWRYRVRSTPADGEAITGERVFTLSEVMTIGEVTSAVTATTVALNIPDFTAFDQQDARGTARLSALGLELTDAAGAVSVIPMSLAPGATWTDSGLSARVGDAVTLQLATLGDRRITQVLPVTYTRPDAPAPPVAMIWLAPEIGLLQRIDYVTHGGQAWEIEAELSDYPGK